MTPSSFSHSNSNLSPQQITRFAQAVLGKPLYPYQSEIAEAILSSILGGQGNIFTVMLARQMGKNQVSAVLEAYLLACMPHGSIVKAAPTFHPQIMNSRLRLLAMLDTPLTRKRIWTSDNIIGLAPKADPILRRNHAGPRILFYSANMESNVVGATADLLLEIDEAQDVSSLKFDRDFRPMSSTRNATTILYGTAWTDNTLLAQQRAINLELEQRTGQKLHFEYDWQTLAAINPPIAPLLSRRLRDWEKIISPFRHNTFCVQSVARATFWMNCNGCCYREPMHGKRHGRVMDGISREWMLPVRSGQAHMIYFLQADRRGEIAPC